MIPVSRVPLVWTAWYCREHGAAIGCASAMAPEAMWYKRRCDEAAVGAVASRVHRQGGRGGRVHLLQRGRATARAPRRARARAAEQVPVRVGTLAGRAHTAHGRLRFPRSRRGGGDPFT